MKETNKKFILLRYSLVVFLMLVFASAIVFSMFKTTVVQASSWNAKADSVINKVTEVEPERGKLLADNGTVLAANLHYYTVRIDGKSTGINDSIFMASLPALSDSMAVFEPSRTAEQWRAELLDAYHNKKSHSYRLLRRQLTHGEWVRLKTFPFFKLAKNKNGLYYESEVKRSKPYGSMASRSIGIVAKTRFDTVAKTIDDPYMRGRAGLEKALDSLLYGIPGEAHSLQLNNRIIPVEQVPAVPGYDITTTINVTLQDIVETELYNMCRETEAEWGTCVLMEVATGEIKAIRNLTRNKITGDYAEGRNHAVLGYEPGSVMKPISMMIALEDGIVKDIDKPMVTGTTWIYEGRAIKDPHGGAQLTPRQIIETSSNIGMSRIIVQKYAADPGKFRDRLEGLGFFEPINSGIAGEQTPIIQRLGRTRADRVALTRMAFGYSTLIPPLSTLAMYNAIANDGKYVRPHLVKKLSREGTPDSIVPVTYIRERVCSPENAQKLRIMMRDVVWGSRGTARKWVQDERVPIAGKTGTAYTIQGKQYSSQKRLAFCGFFPYDKPKYSCIVLMLGANRGAGASSGMVVKNVALKMYARGLLGGTPDYTVKTDGNGNTVKREGGVATLYAKPNGGQQVRMTKDLGIKKARVFKQPQPSGKGVPDVRGLGARDAIRRLEGAGLTVRFSGAGYVTSQSMAAGSPYSRGQVIQLVLRN